MLSSSCTSIIPTPNQFYNSKIDPPAYLNLRLILSFTLLPIDPEYPEYAVHVFSSHDGSFDMALLLPFLLKNEAEKSQL